VTNARNNALPAQNKANAQQLSNLSAGPTTDGNDLSRYTELHVTSQRKTDVTGRGVFTLKN